MSAGRCRPVTAVVGVTASWRARTMAVSVTPAPSCRHSGSGVGWRRRSARPRSDGGTESPDVRSSATSGLASLSGLARVAGACAGKRGPSLATTPSRHSDSAECDGLGQLVGERRLEAEHAAASRDEVQAREIAGEHGGMPTVLVPARRERRAASRGRTWTARPPRRRDHRGRPGSRRRPAAPAAMALRACSRSSGTVAASTNRPSTARQVRTPRQSALVISASGSLPPPPGVMGQTSLRQGLPTAPQRAGNVRPVTRASSSIDVGSWVNASYTTRCSPDGGRQA